MLPKFCETIRWVERVGRGAYRKREDSNSWKDVVN